MQHGCLPPGLAWQRTTDDFDATSVPAGLLRSHRIAPEVWGELEVVAERIRAGLRESFAYSNTR